MKPRISLMLGLAISLHIASAAYAQPAPGATCAVLPAGRGESEAAAAALIEQELGSIAGIKLVERAVLKAVLDEQLLAAALSPEGIGQRVKLGKLLKADLLVILREVNPDKPRSADGDKPRNRERNPAVAAVKTPAAPPRSPQAGGTKSTQPPDANSDARSLEAVVISTGRGIRLGRDAFPLETDKLPATARGIADLVQKSLAIDRSPSLLLFGVPGFEHLDTVPERVDHRAAYAGLIEQFLARLPGAVVVELAEAKALAQEAAVSGSAIQRSMPYYVIGSFSTAGGPDRVSLRLELQHGQQTIASVGPQDSEPTNCAAALESMLGQLIGKLDDRKLPAAGPKQEAELIVRRATLFRRIGEMDQALPLYESALLLDSNNLEAHLGVFEGVSDLMCWGGAHALKNRFPIDYDGRLEYWNQALDQLEWLLLQDPVDDRAFRLIWSFLRFAHLDQPSLPERAGYLPECKRRCLRQTDLLLRLTNKGRMPRLKRNQIDATMVLFVSTCSQLCQIGESTAAMACLERAVLAMGDEPSCFEWQLYATKRVGRVEELRPEAFASLLDRLEASSIDQVKLVGEVCRVLTKIKDQASYQASLPVVDRLTATPNRLCHRDFVRKTALVQLQSLAPPATQPSVPDEILPRLIPMELQFEGTQVHARPEPTAWLTCGNEEAVCTADGVFRMGDSGRLIQIDAEGASAAIWDGRYIWAIGKSGQPRIIDLHKGRVGQISDQQDPEGLSSSAKLFPVSPGQVCAVSTARVGLEKTRSWAVLLKAQDQANGSVACQVETLFKARNALDKLNASGETDPLSAFIPTWYCVLPARNQRGPRLLIGRFNDEHPVCFSISERKARVLPHPWPRGATVLEVDGDIFLVASIVTGQTEHSRIYRVHEPDDSPEVWLDLGERPCGRYVPERFYEAMTRCGDELHLFNVWSKEPVVPAWTAVDLKTREVRELMSKWPVESRFVPSVFRTRRSGLLLASPFGARQVGPPLRRNPQSGDIAVALSDTRTASPTEGDELHAALTRLMVQTRLLGASWDPWGALRRQGLGLVASQNPKAFDAFISELRNSNGAHLPVIGRVLGDFKVGRLQDYETALLQIRQALRDCRLTSCEERWFYDSAKALLESGQESSIRFIKKPGIVEMRNAGLPERLKTLRQIGDVRLQYLEFPRQSALFGPGYIRGWTQCGAFEVLYSRQSLCVMKERGVVEPCTPPAGRSWRDVQDVQWDGQNLWILESENTPQIEVLDGATFTLLSSFGAADGMPASSERIKIAMLGPGRACVVGGGRTAWMACLELKPTKAGPYEKHARVFYRSSAVADGDKLAPQQKPDVAFVPSFVTAVAPPSAAPVLIVGRIACPKYWSIDPLIVRPYSGEVSESPWGAMHGVTAAGDRLWFCQSGTNEFFSCQLPSLQPHHLEGIEDLPRGGIGQCVLDGHLLHGLSDEFVTLDLEKGKVLRRIPLPRDQQGTLLLSRFYGLVLRGDLGAWQVTFTEESH